MQNTAYDRQLAQRVWKRVQGNPEPVSTPPLEELIATEWVDSRRCLLLSKHYKGKNRALLQRISQQKQLHVQCLKGIGRMQTGQVPQVPCPPVRPWKAEECCQHMEECRRQYRALSEDPVYGSYYAWLAERSEKHCRSLLPLLGDR